MLRPAEDQVRDDLDSLYHCAEGQHFHDDVESNAADAWHLRLEVRIWGIRATTALQRSGHIPAPDLG